MTTLNMSILVKHFIPGRFLAVALVVMALFIACTPSPALVEPQFSPDKSVEDYQKTIQGLKLQNTTLGQGWIQASQVPTTLPGLTLVPYTEIRHFSDSIPEAAWILFEAVRGHTITINLNPQGPMGYFADLFGMEGEVGPDETLALDQGSIAAVASAHFISSDKTLRQGPSSMVFEPRGTRFYLLRILPRLLEGGTMNIEIGTTPLASVWPVDDTGKEDIWSFFGDPRDGGRRVHHGVDIFAPRGTPIRAPIGGRITRIGERSLGGLSVSMTDDERRLMLYFAHLDSYGDIAVNQVVEAGHVLGTVGNTGNAITTPPHLHLGIYDRGFGGPVDPWYFIMPLTRSRAPTPTTLQESWKDTLERFPLGTRFTYDSQALVATRGFFAQAPGLAPIQMSPAKRDASGLELQAQDRPFQRLTWARPYQGSSYQGSAEVEVQGSTAKTIRLVALRDQALGFIFPDGSLQWTDLSRQSRAYLTSNLMDPEA